MMAAGRAPYRRHHRGPQGCKGGRGAQGKGFLAAALLGLCAVAIADDSTVTVGSTRTQRRWPVSRAADRYGS